MEESLSVVIPAYNEESRIIPTLTSVSGFLKDNFPIFEIIVVDDGSSDNTATVVKTLAQELGNIELISYPVNQGKGYAVRKGVLACSGKLILFSDADMSTPVEELQRLIPPIREGFDIAIGSRGLRESDVRLRQPWYRQSMGKTFNLMVRLLTVGGIRDTQCGFKLFRSEAARNLFGNTLIRGFAFDVEVLFLAAKFGYKTKEVPVRWFNSPGSKVRIVRDSLRMFLELLRIRIYYLSGKYAAAERKREVDLPES